MGTLYSGDDLEVLRRWVADGSVDLVYLDPPFECADAAYPFLKEHEDATSAGGPPISAGQPGWNEQSQAAFHELSMCGEEIGAHMRALLQSLGRGRRLASLTDIAAHLLELRRVLTSTGSLVLKCDETGRDCFKRMLDAIFGAANFRRELACPSFCEEGDAHEETLMEAGSILIYSRTADSIWNPGYIDSASDLSSSEVLEEVAGRMVDEHKAGRAAELGSNLTWREAKPSSKCRWCLPLAELGKLWEGWSFLKKKRPAPTEQQSIFASEPLALLDRIIQATSKAQGVVLDPFCAEGPTLIAAQRQQRQWIGIDQRHRAITFAKYELFEAFGTDLEIKFVGGPGDLSAARELAAQDECEFQCWALGLIGARPVDAGKGALLVDGEIVFPSSQDSTQPPEKILVSVTKEAPTVEDVRALLQGAATIRVFISLEDPTEALRAVAGGAGFHTSSVDGRRYPRVQLRTVNQLLNGESIQQPARRLMLNETAARKGITPVAQGVRSASPHPEQRPTSREQMEALGVLWTVVESWEQSGDIDHRYFEVEAIIRQIEAASEKDAISLYGRRRLVLLRDCVASLSKDQRSTREICTNAKACIADLMFIYAKPGR